MIRKLAFILVLSFALSATLAVFLFFALPWKETLGKGLQAVLKKQGIENVDFTISELGLRSARFDSLSIGGGENPLVLNNLALGYTPLDLWKGHLDSVTLTGLTLDIKQQDGIWIVQGFVPGPARGASGLRIPVSSDVLGALPVRSIVFNDSQLRVTAAKWALTAPLRAEWTRAPARIEAALHQPEFSHGNIRARAEGGQIGALLNEAQSAWEGSWSLDNLQINELPVMQAGGVLKAVADGIMISGTARNEDRQYNAAFELNYLLSDASKAALVVKEAVTPWKGGMLAVENLTIPLARTRPLNFTLQVRQVSVGELLETLTGKRVTATGKVSGNLPLILAVDGTILPGDGALQATGPGIITMPPDVIPGDNEQIALTREILQNFHYEGLKIGVSGTGQGLSLLVVLEGNNPDVYEGRPVKLNVRLTGDILDLIRQNAMLLTDPTTLLQQGKQ